MREGRDLAAIDEHIVVKVPFTQEGVRACKTLSGEGLRVNVTLIFSAAQALLAAKVGATYVSPFVGRLDDIGHDRHGPDSSRSSRSSRTTTTRPRCSWPASAARSTSSKRRAWAPTSAPCPAEVIDQLFNHPLTDIGLERFLKDWEKAQAATRVTP